MEALLERAGLARTQGASAADRRPDVEEALAIAEASGDLTQVANVRTDLAWLAAEVGQLGEARVELEDAVSVAQQSGDVTIEARARRTLNLVMLWGIHPASEMRRILADNLAFARQHGQRFIEAHTLRAQAVDAARRGLLPEARRMLSESLAIIDGIGLPLRMAAASLERGLLESLAGDRVAREQVLREGYEQLIAMGERAAMPTIAADLADALVDLGRIDEAAALCDVAEEAAADDDLGTQVGVRLVRGRLAAARGKLDEALTLVANALALADEGEFYDSRTLSRLAFAELLLDAGRIDEARIRAQEVLDLARPRGDVLYAKRATDLLGRMTVSTPRRS